MRSSPAWRSAVALLTGASGFAGLAYQVIWTQQGALWLGHESAAVLAIVAGFFGGMSLGALLLGRAVRNTRTPLRWYIACELLVAVWAIALNAGFHPIADFLLRLIGAESSGLWQWTIAFGGTLLLLLPASAAMGLALPALERLVAARQAERSVFGGLYAANTAGAMLGVLLAAFWLIPSHGLGATATLGALINLLCAAAAFALFRHDSSPKREEPLAVRMDSSRRALLLRLAATGLLGIGYEVVVLRVLGQVTEQTVYTFACALAAYLLGTTCGAAAYQRWWAARRDVESTGRLLIAGVSLAVLVATAGLWFAESLRLQLAAWLGGSLQSAIGIESVLALAAFSLPTFLMGALFSHQCAVAKKAGAGLGEATGWNGVGAALAPVLFGVIAVPALGPKWSLLLLSIGYLAVLPRSAASLTWTLPPLAVALSLASFAPRLAFIEVPPGGSVVRYQEGATAAVSVVKDRDGVSRLRIDNRQQEGSSDSHWFDARQAWLPLLLHPAPHTVLFLGMGTGVTSSSATEDPGLEVDVVELLPEVIAASRHFTAAFAGAAPRSNARAIAADARRFVKSSKRQYDLIIADNFHPARSGAGSLYTVEHFQAVKSRLAPGGIFCQWLPLHQLDLDSLRSIVRSYLQVFPEATAMLASNSIETPVVALLGHDGDSGFDGSAVAARRLQATRVQDLNALGLEDEFAILGSLVAGPRALKRFAAPGTLNTDDHPVVAYRAPFITYSPDSLPRDRLIQLLAEWQIDPDEALRGYASPQLGSRLAAYWQARDLYIDAGSRVKPTSDVRQMLAQVREPLLAALHRSPDFRPAFNPLLQMAQVLAASDPSAARELAGQLTRIRPEDSSARALLEQTAR